jgi:hypothetical protein
MHHSIQLDDSYRFHISFSPGKPLEGESSNHYRDFIPAKGIIRWLSLCNYPNDPYRIIDKLLNLQFFQPNSRKGIELESVDIRKTAVSLATIIAISSRLKESSDGFDFVTIQMMQKKIISKLHDLQFFQQNLPISLNMFNHCNINVPRYRKF